MKQSFRAWSNRIADKLGSPGAFAAGILLVLIWGLTGPLFRFSDTWQLVINTGTSVVTFLMVFLIQNTQNRDTQAMQLKLNELIRAVSTARNTLLDLENCTEDEIEAMQKEFAAIREKMASRNDLKHTATALTESLKQQ